MNYWHDGYYSYSESVYKAIIRLCEEGWTIVAVLPSNGAGMSIVASHPTETRPSWERTTESATQGTGTPPPPPGTGTPFAFPNIDALVKQARPVIKFLADMLKEQP